MTMKQIRILNLLDKLSVGGSKIHGPARQLAYHIPNFPDNHKVLICGFREDQAASEFLEQHGLEVVCLGRSKYDVRVLGDIQRLVREWEPTILHLHGYAAWTFGRIVGRRTGVPVVVQEHFIDERVPAIQKVADYALRKQQQLGIAVSGAVRKFMTDDRYIRHTPVEVIWNAIPVEDIRKEASTADNRQLRAALNIPAEGPVVGIVSRLAEGKGHDCFFQAAVRVRQARPDAHFVVVGEGPLRAALEQHAEKLGLGDRIRFVGHQANVVPFFSMFSVSVLPSISEGFHIAALESLAAGTPIVLADLEAYRGVYTDEENVLLVPVGDPAATASATLRILADPALAGRLVDNARQTLSACSLEAILPKYLNVYQRLACQTSR